MLDKIGLKYHTDKSSEHHDYLKNYETYLSPLKETVFDLIEIGVGGYEFPDRGGESLRMWYEYFPHARLTGIDIYNKEGIINDRTEFWQGSQTDENLLTTILKRNDNKKVVIDDGSHNNHLTIKTFNIVFPLLKSGDLYFVEDVHSSYWDDKEYEGKTWPGEPMTTMWFFTNLCHQLNAEHLKPEYRNGFADTIEFIHFYKGLIVIKKRPGS